MKKLVPVKPVELIWVKTPYGKIRCYRIPLPPSKRRINKRYVYPIMPNWFYPSEDPDLSDEQYHIYTLARHAGWDDEAARQIAVSGIAACDADQGGPDGF